MAMLYCFLTLKHVLERKKRGFHFMIDICQWLLFGSWTLLLLVTWPFFLGMDLG